MLSVRLICVGKLGEKFWKQACDEYVKRLGGFCKIEVVELPEQKLPQAPTPGQIENALDREARLIQEKIPAGAAVIAMCIEGKALSSEQLAQTIGNLAVSGTSRLAIVLGGSFGRAASVNRGARRRRWVQMSATRSRFSWPRGAEEAVAWGIWGRAVV